MKKINNILIALASITMMVSCTSDFTAVEELDSNSNFSFQASMPEDVDAAAGDEVGYFSINNNNVVFSTKESGENVVFSGKLENDNEGEFSYVAYPYVKGASLDQNRNYTFSIPAEQIQDTYNSQASLSKYNCMVGYSTSTKSASSYQFHSLMSKMNIVVANNTGAPQAIKRVTMSTENGTVVFSTSASINMNPTKVNLDSYSVNAPSESSLSVRISNPESINVERSQTISLMFFPASLEAATRLVFTIETESGTYTTTKTIGGLSTLNMQRGRTYITPIEMK